MLHQDLQALPSGICDKILTLRFFKAYHRFFIFIIANLSRTALFLLGRTHTYKISPEYKQFLREGCKSFFAVANHCFYLDPAATTIALGKSLDVFYGVLPETFGNKAVAWLIQALGSFPVDTHTFLKSARTMQEILRQKGIIVFFPEGEMTRFSQTMQPFEKGAFFIAAKENTPIVCVVHVLTKRPLMARLTGLRLPRITTHILPPIFPKELQEQSKVPSKELSALLAQKTYTIMQDVLTRYGDHDVASWHSKENR